MDHGYEEVRAAALDLLAGREKAPYEVNQYQNLAITVAEAFARREKPPEALQGSRQLFHLSPADSELCPRRVSACQALGHHPCAA